MKKRAPFKPAIKVICIPPVLVAILKLEYREYDSSTVNPENYMGERNVADDDRKVGVHSAYNTVYALSEITRLNIRATVTLKKSS